MKYDIDIKTRKMILGVVVFAVLLVFIIAFIAKDTTDSVYSDGDIKTTTSTTKKVLNDSGIKVIAPTTFTYQTKEGYVNVGFGVERVNEKVNLAVHINDKVIVDEYRLMLYQDKTYWTLSSDNIFVINGRDKSYFGIELFNGNTWEFAIYNSNGDKVYDAKDDTSEFIVVDNENYVDGKSYYFKDGKIYIMEFQGYDEDKANFKEKQLILNNDKVTKRFIKNYSGTTGEVE